MLTTSVLAQAAATGTDDLNGIAGWVADVIVALGPVGVGVLVAVENVFPPLPSEIVLPLAGFLAGRGRMDPVSVTLAATLGSLVGALVFYEVARRLGADRLRRTLVRLYVADDDDFDRARSWFERHGGRAVLIGRCVPVVRSLISFPAGADRMPRLPFVVYTVVGSGVWNTAWVTAGYLLGGRWKDASSVADVLSYAVLAGLAVLLGMQVKRVVRRRRDAREHGADRQPRRRARQARAEAATRRSETSPE